MDDEFDRLGKVAREGSLEELGERISEAIGAAIPHDAYYLQGIDPAAGIESFGVGGSLADGFLGARLRDGELRDWGFVGELCIALTTGRRKYGALMLWRSHKAFAPEEVSFAKELGKSLVPVLRAYVTGAGVGRPVKSLPPGVLVMGRDSVTAMSAEAREWLHEIPHWTPWKRGRLPVVAIHQLSHAARRALSDNGKPRAVTCVPAARCGRWVEIHGQVLGGDLTLIIRRAGGAQLVSSLAWWYGITPRERQVLDLLCEGASSKQIAKVLALSTHTVNEYLQSIYRKTGSGGRDELIALLLQG